MKVAALWRSFADMTDLDRLRATMETIEEDDTPACGGVGLCDVCNYTAEVDELLNDALGG